MWVGFCQDDIVAPRLIRLSQRWPLPTLRLWRDPSWPVDGVPPGACAVEWCSSQPGHPTSYALLGVHRGPDTATEAHRGEQFNDSLAGRADDVRFDLPSEYRAAVDAVLTPDFGLSPCLAAHGIVGSSLAAFRALAIFVRDSDERLWCSDDPAVAQTWLRALDVGQSERT